MLKRSTGISSHKKKDTSKSYTFYIQINTSDKIWSHMEVTTKVVLLTYRSACQISVKGTLIPLIRCIAPKDFMSKLYPSYI